VARPERFELPTYSSGGCRSIQLSYGRVYSVYIEPTSDAAAEQEAHRNSRGALVLQTARNFPELTSASIASTGSGSFTLRSGFIHVNGSTTELCSV
jgi:hypothetical protein